MGKKTGSSGWWSVMMFSKMSSLKCVNGAHVPGLLVCSILKDWVWGYWLSGQEEFCNRSKSVKFINCNWLGRMEVKVAPALLPAGLSGPHLHTQTLPGPALCLPPGIPAVLVLLNNMFSLTS